MEILLPEPIHGGPTGESRVKIQNEAAVMKVLNLEDVPIDIHTHLGIPRAHAACIITLVYFNCDGQVLWKGRYGMADAYGKVEDITERYSYYSDMIARNIPAIGTFIDLRTTRQLLNGCCPPMLYP